MISGFSSIFTHTINPANRTLRKATSELETIATQMASGKKVTSVKDDSSTYLRVQNLRNELPTWEVRSMTLDRAKVGMDWVNVVNSTADEAFSKLSELVLEAQQYPAGSVRREALQAQWDEVTNYTKSFAATGNNPTFTGTGAGSGWDSVSNGYDLGAIDSFYGTNTLNAHPNGSAWDGWMTSTSHGAAPRGFDLVNATSADFTSVSSTITARKTNTQNWYRNYSLDLSRVERLESEVNQNVDRINSQIGSLEDVDIGKLSQKYENVSTQQQLALKTIKSALNQYSEMSQYLLSQVQQSQYSFKA